MKYENNLRGKHKIHKVYNIVLNKYSKPEIYYKLVVVISVKKKNRTVILVNITDIILKLNLY